MWGKFQHGIYSGCAMVTAHCCYPDRYTGRKVDKWNRERCEKCPGGANLNRHEDQWNRVEDPE